MEISNVKIDLDELEQVFDNMKDGDMGCANIAALYYARLEEKSINKKATTQQNQQELKDNSTITSITNITSNQVSNDSSSPFTNFLRTVVINRRNYLM